MQIIRSIVFWIIFYFAVIFLVSGYFLVSLFVKRPSLADEGAKLWSQAIIFLLRLIFGINYKIIGKEKIPQTPCIIACKHQSAWETIVFHLICKHPAYIYKKELLKVPFYGWFIKRMSGVEVDRDGGASALKNLLKQAKSMISKGHNIVIFPQGTRIPYGASVSQYPYQVGVAALYASCNVEVVPAALNSGAFWGKGFLIKKSGTITLEFLDPIKTGLNKEEFMQKLEEKIENSCKNL